MNYVIEVVRPAGAPTTLPTHFEFDAPDNADAAELRRLAEEQIRARWGNSGYYPGNVEYDVYKDANSDHRGVAAERLGFRTGEPRALPWSTGGLSRFSSDVAPRDGDRPLASVDLPTDAEIPADLRAALRRLSYRADGQPGMSNAEKDSFLANLEETIRSNPAWAPHFATVVGRGNVTFQGVTGTQPLSRIYDERGVDRSGFSTRTTDWWNSRTGAGSASNPNGANPSDPNYTYAPSESLETRRGRLRDRMGNLDAILAVLAAAIAGGNLDALRSFAILAGARTGLAVADVATIVADSMRNLNIGDDASRAALVTAMRDGNPTGPNAGTRAAESRSRIQEIQNQLQQNDQLRQMLMQSLRDNMSRKESSDTFTDSILSHADREASHYRWS